MFGVLDVVDAVDAVMCLSLLGVFFRDQTINEDCAHSNRGKEDLTERRDKDAHRAAFLLHVILMPLDSCKVG